jgi:hypothetical protein
MSDLCRKILSYVNDPCGVWQILRGKILANFLPASLVGVSDGICHRALVDESGMIRTQMGSTVDQKMTAVHGALCTIPPRNSNQ